MRTRLISQSPVTLFLLISLGFQLSACTHASPPPPSPAPAGNGQVSVEKVQTPEQALNQANDKLSRRDGAGAISDARRLLVAAPEFLEGHVFLAMCYELAGHTAEAQRAWEEMEKQLVYAGKNSTFILQSTLFAAAEHFLKRGKRDRSQIFLDELWRRFPESEWSIKGHLIVVQTEFERRKWRAVIGACADLRRRHQNHPALQICAELVAAAERMLELGPEPPPSAGTWDWENPLPQGNALNSVWIAANGDLYAVGEGGAIVQRRKKDSGLSLMDSGTRWSLKAVSGLAGGEELYAAGAGGMVLRYEGGKWSELRPSSPTSADVNGLQALGPKWLIAVAQDGSVEEWRDGRWTSAKPATVPLRAVWGSGAERIFAVGDGGLLLNYDGQAWKTLNSDAYEDLQSIWGVGGQLVVAVGNKRTAVFFDGQRAKESVIGAEDLRGVWAAEEKKIWAVGLKGHILHYNGRDWKKEYSPTLVDLLEVGGAPSAALGEKEVWAVGRGGTILKRQNRRWDIVAGGVGQSLVGVAVSKSGDALAVGERGLLLKRLQGRWQKVGWSVFGEPRDLCSDGERWFVAGVKGLLAMRAPNGSWRTFPNKTNEDLLAVAAWPGDNGGAVAVGTRGTVARLSGDKVIIEQTPSGLDLFGVWALADNDIYAVGARGTIVHFDGAKWREQESGTNNDLRAVYAAGENETVAVGNDGTILRRIGNSWQAQQSPLGDDLVDIWGSGAANWTFIASRKGHVLRYDGQDWQTERAATQCLTAIGGAGSGEIYAAGCNGAIIKLRK